MNFIKNFILYSRLHTIIGTTISVSTLYIITIALSPEPVDYHWVGFILTLISCLGANIYIVGLNQITDIEIDKINKPYLPLASGAYTVKKAYIINTIALLISISIAFYFGKFLLITVLSSLILGTIYSLPPFRLKRYYFWAAFCIIAVRGILVNIFLFLHLHTMVLGYYHLPDSIRILTIAIFIYSIVIAWFKDIPDMTGDQKFDIQTLSLRIGSKTVFIFGNTLLALVFVFLIAASLFFKLELNTTIFIVMHILMLLALIYKAVKTDVNNKTAISKYYQFIWVLFFAEYIVFALASISA
ncbi:MAG: homogentisate phytyltransferase [Bacteroidetes bacterium]|nr:homogentisate phytyltransferase [Bacteroidota bacterium]